MLRSPHLTVLTIDPTAHTLINCLLYIANELKWEIIPNAPPLCMVCVLLAQVLR